MKHSLIPVTFDEQHGVNLPMFQRVLFVPGQNMWGLDPEVEVEGTYVGWNRPQFSALEIKIDHIQSGPLPLRFNVPIENVFRIWDARDDEIEALRKENASLNKIIGVLKDTPRSSMQGERTEFDMFGGHGISLPWNDEDALKRLKGDPD